MACRTDRALPTQKLLSPGDGHLMNWHVPIDDTHHWRYSMAFKRSGPIDPGYAQARSSVTDENFHSPRTKANRYLQDREEQKHDTYAGMGSIFVVQDAYATETAGEIQDRTREHLGASDPGLAAARRMMLGRSGTCRRAGTRRTSFAVRRTRIDCSRSV